MELHERTWNVTIKNIPLIINIHSHNNDNNIQLNVCAMPSTGWVFYLIHPFYHLPLSILPSLWGSSHHWSLEAHQDRFCSISRQIQVWKPYRGDAMSHILMVKHDVSTGFPEEKMLYDLQAKKKSWKFPSRLSRDGDKRGRSCSRWREQHVQTWRNMKMQNVFRDWEEVQNSYTLDPVWARKLDEAEARLQRHSYTLQRYYVGSRER